MSLFRDPMANSGNLVSLALGATMMGIAAYLPVYVQGVMGKSAITAGLVLMAMSAVSPIGAVLAGRIMLRSSYRVAAATGAVVYIAGSLMMNWLTPSSALAWPIVAALFLGLGIGLNNNTYMVAIQADAAWNMRGIATSAFIFARILGQAAGAAAFGGIINVALSRYLTGGGDLVAQILSPAGRATLSPAVLQPLMQEFDHALHIVFVILTALAVLTLVIGFMLPKGRGIRK
jgi:MFS family permease